MLLDFCLGAVLYPYSLYHHRLLLLVGVLFFPSNVFRFTSSTVSLYDLCPPYMICYTTQLASSCVYDLLLLVVCLLPSSAVPRFSQSGRGAYHGR